MEDPRITYKDSIRTIFYARSKDRGFLVEFNSTTKQFKILDNMKSHKWKVVTDQEAIITLNYLLHKAV